MAEISDSMPASPTRRSVSFRAGLLLGAVLLLYAALAGRLLQLQYIEHPSLDDHSREQMASQIQWSPWRGQIVDAAGRVIAMSHKVHSCAIDPLVVERDGVGLEPTVNFLADELHLAPADVQRIREQAARSRFDDEGNTLLDESGQPRKRRFVWVKRLLDEGEYERLRDAIGRHAEAARAEADQTGDDPVALRGITFPAEYRRRYPEGELMAHIVGFTNIDGVGQEGVERMADAFLRGVPESRFVQRDARRRVLAEHAAQASDERHGLTVELSLDATLQLIAEEELGKAVEKYTPVSASVIVMNPYTGDVLALANHPTFDPNAPADTPTGNRINRAVASIVEPGSTFKPIVFAAALDQGLIELSTPFHCEGGAWRMANGRVLHDAHGYGMLSAESVIVKSSNIGIAKIAMLLGRDGLYRTVRDYGFGEKTGVSLIGEEDGMVRPLRQWTSYSMGSVPMGQEIAVTPMQLASAYCVFANGGSLPRPRIVRKVTTRDGETVHRFPVIMRRRGLLRPETAAQVRRVLRKVVTDGTGRRLQMAEYAVGGKTGTAQLAVNAEEIRAGHTGYSPDRYSAAFVGIAPSDVPRFVVLATVREPHGAYYGGVVSGPIVREVCKRGLRYMGEPLRGGEETVVANR